ncbi:MAG: chromosome segregation protein SMC [Clostridia bacterium]|nr:chromosome segregation protein SMC [Clostridia bacterium]
MALKFKKIEMFGFKSFADKIEVKFEPGVTGIVGPNGCGKSNVSDAIRWVMGEQSAKALRGANMQDVIFNGTDTRKRQSFCEVSLYFDNTQRIFPLEYDEVVFTRKLYRSGESEYMINKTPCRMKDVVDALRDTGLGRDSYCVIGQGKIDSLLSVKPEDRRAIFEEAAGISKFKSRKIEAERKLERVAENITRLSDIISELERQLGPLKDQSENAKKFLELKDRLKNLELNIYVYQFDSASDNKAKISARIEELANELEVKQHELQAVLDEYTFSRESIQNLDYSLTKLRDEQLDLTVSLEKKFGQGNLLKERLNGATSLRDSLNQDISQDEALTLTLSDKINELKEASVKAEEKLEEINKIIEETNKTYLDIVDRITAGETAAEESGNEIYSALEKMGDVKNAIGSLQGEKNSLLSRRIEIESRKKNIALDKENLNAKISELDKEKQRISQNLSSLTNKQGELESSLTAINQTISDTQTAYQEELANYHTLLSRAKIMQEMAEENEGYILSVKRLLEQSKTNSSLGGKIIGVVAKLMNVPERYETAIEMALGASVQNVVTHNEEDAKYIVNYLKDRKFGRATFLPVSSMKERSIPSDMLSKLNSKGVLGIASDLISYDKNLTPIFKSLLGSTVIVDSIDNAIELAKASRYSFKIVTLEGDVINPQGSISGGSKKESAVNLISRERELADTKKAAENSKEEVTRLSKKLEEITSKRSAQNDKLGDCLNEVKAAEISLTKVCDDIIALKDNLESLNDEDKSLSVSIETILDKVEIIDKTLAEVENKEQEINDQRFNASETKKMVASKYDALKKEREKLFEELTDLRVKKANIENEINANNAELDRCETELAISENRINENKLNLQKNQTIIAELENELSKIVDVSEQSQVKTRLDEIVKELSNLDIEKAEFQARMNNADSKKMELNSDISRAQDRKTKEEMNLSKVDTDIEAMQERVWEEYSMTYADCLNYKDLTFDLTKGLSESAKIKKEISALGFVNVSAIEDIKTVTARYDDLTAQRDDLTKTRDDLTGLIGELTKQMETRFTEQFNLINLNFQKTFKELFGGGRCELVLQDDVSCLEAGIDIIAEPPGKKLQNINLLSGGEKAITAIAILFAILKLRPMPFCVLDEIEAALDDANVDRFANYLKRFSEDTQFIVITHRKPTMELADSLYGVTMEEKGVSKIVSVKLSDAVKNSTEGA